MSGSSSTAHSTVYINLTASTEKLDSYSTARHPGTCSQPRQPRQLLDRLDRQGLDSASTVDSTAPRRSLDSSTARQPGLKAKALGCVSATRAPQQWLHGARLCECCLDRIVAGCQIRQGSGCKGLALSVAFSCDSNGGIDYEGG